MVQFEGKLNILKVAYKIIYKFSSKLSLHKHMYLMAPKFVQIFL